MLGWMGNRDRWLGGWIDGWMEIDAKLGSVGLLGGGAELVSAQADVEWR